MTSPLANTTQAEVWNGATGVRWADNHWRYDTMARGFNDGLFHAAALGDGDRVLDIGRGTVHITRLAARRARRGHAVGIDLSAPMLERTRRLAAQDGIGNVTIINADAQLRPFPGESFDVAVSRHGVVFFADPVTAFTNVRDALTPGGRLVFTCNRGGANGTSRIVEAMAEHFPPPDEQSTAVALFADPGYVREVVTAAGFDRFTATPIETVAPLGSDAADAAAYLFEDHLHPFVRDANEPARQRARMAVTEVLKTFEREGAVQYRHRDGCTRRYGNPRADSRCSCPLGLDPKASARNGGWTIRSAC